MNVDLKRLELYGRAIVRCTSEEHARMFMDAMWEQYPALVSDIWNKGQTNWNRYREDEGSICYLPRIVRDRLETPYCQSTKLDIHKYQEYTLVEFVDLLVGFDLGELPAPIFDIKCLFDMG